MDQDWVNATRIWQYSFVPATVGKGPLRRLSAKGFVGWRLEFSLCNHVKSEMINSEVLAVLKHITEAGNWQPEIFESNSVSDGWLGNLIEKGNFLKI